MNEDLKKWCEDNNIAITRVDDDIININGFGKAFVEDTDNLKSIFRTDHDGNVKFNTMEDPKILEEDEIFYIIFKFGDNWFYWDVRKEFKMNVLKYVGSRTSYRMADVPEFVNLGVHSPFELLNGSFALSEWVRKTVYLRQNALGICDYNTMAGTLILQKECLAAGITPVFGYSLTFIDDLENKVGAKVYCQSQYGMKNLLRIQKAINVDSDDGLIDIRTLQSFGHGNVIVFDKYSSDWLIKNKHQLNGFIKRFNNVFYQVDLTEFKAERIDIRVLNAAKLYFNKLYPEKIVPPVLIQDCYYLDKVDSKNKIILNKIATGAAHEQSNDQYFKDMDEHYELFCQTFDSERWDIKKLFDECCANTVLIARNADARYATDRNFMPQYMMTPEEKAKYGTRHEMFLDLLEDGFKKLVPKGEEEKYRKRLNYETYILESTNNIDYMLVQYDTVNWARKNGILVGCGRGSAGGALVLYLLGITLIDPIKYDLIFERFLLPERAGLFASKATIIGQDIESQHYVEATLENGKTYKIDKDAQLLVNRKGNDKPIVIYADELKNEDDIIFDNKDLIFTLNEINAEG